MTCRARLTFAEGGDPVLEESAFRFVLGQFPRLPVGRDRFGRPAEPAKKVGSYGDEVVVAVELSATVQPLHHTERGSGSRDLGQGDCPVQGDHR